MVVGSDEPRELYCRAATWWSQHDNLGAGVRDATHGVDEFALDECRALDFQSETNEERGSGIKIGDGDTDVIEGSQLTHSDRSFPHLAILVRGWVTTGRAESNRSNENLPARPVLSKVPRLSVSPRR
jgi:hypothetical protein